VNVDRQNRDRLVLSIRRFLTEETTAFEFDEEIHTIRRDSDDATLDYVAGALWFHYDDLIDHAVALCRQEWDYFHRLILLLESDAHVHARKERVWCLAQVGAAIGFLGFLICALKVGIGDHLVALTIMFGVFSILLSLWRRQYEPKSTPREQSLIPFSSVRELLTVRRSVEGFVKLRYPNRVQSRRIRSPMMTWWLQRWPYVLWLLLSPIVLLMQVMPVRTVKTTVGLSH